MSEDFETRLVRFIAFAKRYGAACAAFIVALYHIFGVPMLYLRTPGRIDYHEYINNLWFTRIPPNYSFEEMTGGEASRSMMKWFWGAELGAILRWHPVTPLIMILFLALGVLGLRYRSSILNYTTLTLATFYLLTYAFVALSFHVLTFAIGGVIP